MRAEAGGRVMRAQALFEIGGGRLRVHEIDQLGDVDLRAFGASADRTVVVARSDELFDDGGIAGFIFRSVLGARGLLEGVRVGLPLLVLDLVSPADQIRGWLCLGLTVNLAAVAVPELVVATVLLAMGHDPASAISVVQATWPEAFADRDLEVAVSVARDHMVPAQELRRRREQAVSEGRSWWSVR